MPLRAGDDYTPHSVDGATGSGITVYLHRKPCKRTQTAPATSRPAMYR
ncbi:hypothetical protein [Streptomyces sp. NPDC002611]